MKQKRRTLLLVLLLLCLGATLALSIIFWPPGSETDASSSQAEGLQSLQPPVDEAEIPSASAIRIPGWEAVSTEERDLGQGLFLLGIGSYSGAFVEDGKDTAVDKILAVAVANRSGQDLQYAELSLETQEGNALFTFSSIPAGGTVLVMESAAKPFSQGTHGKAQLSVAAFFNEGMQFNTEGLAFYTADGVINVKNTGAQMEKGFYLYYKNIINGVYLGGITYRVRIPDDLDTDEVYQAMTHHYKRENSRILFMTYVEE